MRTVSSHSSVIFLALILLAVLGGTAHPERAAAADTREPFEVEVAGGALTLRAEAAPLSNLLSAIAEKANFRLVVEGDLEQPVTRNLAGVPLDRGLERLLDGVSYLRIYDSVGGRPVLTELRVLGPGPANDRAPVSAVVLRRPSRTTPTPDLAARLSAAEDERLNRVRHLRTESGSDVAQELALYLEQDKSPTVRRIAAAGLARQGGLEARDALTAALEDSDALVRRQALLSLAQRWGPEASGALAGALASDPDAEARALAARMLGRTGGAEAGTALEAALQDLDPKVRQVARQSLAQLDVSGSESTFGQ